MKLSLAILAVAPAVAAGKRLKASRELPAADIKASSKTGNRILSKARRLDGGGDEAMSWVAGYSLKFHSCVANQNYYGGWFNGEQNGQQGNYNGQNGQYYQQGQGNNYQNGQYQNQAYGEGQNGYYYNQNGQDRQDFEGLYQQKLVHFKLCPSDSCWSCKNGADYVVELGTYVEAILEAKMTAQEYDCERVRENCYCENANSEQQCLYNCYNNAGLSDCQVENEEEQFDVMEAIECSEYEVEDEESFRSFMYNHMQSNQNKNQNQYAGQNGYYAQNGEQQQQQGEIDKVYVGPYCSANGRNIHLGLFLEETCSISAPDGLHEAMHYGEHLPYSKKQKGLADSGCISCKEPKEVDYNNYWDQQDPDEVTDVCARLYEEAGKCEENLDGYFPYRDNYGCGFIKNMKSPSMLSAPSNVPAKVFAGIFAVTTAVLAGVAAVLFKRNRRQNVSLAGDAIIS